METKTSQYTVFIDPDPHAANRKADWTYTVQVINAAGTTGATTVEMEREEAIALYRKTVVARDPMAYLGAVADRQWAALREAGYPGWPEDPDN